MCRSLQSNITIGTVRQYGWSMSTVVTSLRNCFSEVSSSSALLIVALGCILTASKVTQAEECCPYIPGDCNCDGVVTISDIGPCCTALTNPGLYATEFPGCDPCTADGACDCGLGPPDDRALAQLFGGDPEICGQLCGLDPICGLGIDASKKICPRAAGLVHAFNINCGMCCEVIWSFDGDSLGCSLEPDGWFARVIAGDRTGTVSVRATGIGCGECSVQASIAIGCADGGCRSCGDPGSGRATLGSVVLEWSLGSDNNSGIAGRLYVHRDALDIDSPHPRFVGIDASSSVEVHRATSGYIEQVLAPEIFSQITLLNPLNAREGYAVSFFATDDVASGNSTTGWTLTSGADPLSEWTVENPYASATPPNYSTLLVTKKVDVSGSLTTQAVNLYERSVVTTDVVAWTLTHFGSSSSTPLERIIETEDRSGIDPLVITRVVQRPYVASGGTTWGTISEVVETYAAYAWGTVVVERATKSAPGEADLVHEYAYFDSGETGAPAGRSYALKYEKLPDGGWVWYGYGTSGSNEVFEEIRPWKSELSFPPTKPAVNASGVNGTQFTFDATTRRELERLNYQGGVLVERMVKSYASTGPDITVTEARCGDASCTSSASETTVRAYDGPPEDQDYASITYANGLYDVYARDEGTLSNPTGSSEPAFSASSGGAFTRERVTSYHSTAASATANETLRTETITNSAGREVAHFQYVWTGSTWQRLTWEKTVRDELGRELEVWANGQLQRTLAYNTCCGEKTVTEIDGVATKDSFDPLGRLIERRVLGISATGYPVRPDLVTSIYYEYDATNGYGVERSEADDGSSTWDRRVQKFDWAGRLRIDIDENSYDTEYTYNVSGNNLISTVTRPDGGVEQTERYLDGQVKSITGSGLVSTHIDYSVDTSPTLRVTTSRVGGSASPRKSISKRDMLGRIAVEQRPEFATSDPATRSLLTTAYSYFSFDGSSKSGKLASIDPPDTLPTRYEYDVWGRANRIGMSLDGNNSLDDNSTSDRFTQTAVSYVNGVSGSSRWWRKTSTTDFERMDSGSSVLTLVTDVLEAMSPPASGEPHWDERRIVGVGQSNPVTTRRTIEYVPADGLRNETSYAGDGSSVQRVIYNGLLHSVRHANQSKTEMGYDGFGRLSGVTDPRVGTTARTYHAGTSQVHTIIDPGFPSSTTTMTYYANGEAGARRVKTITNLNGKLTRYQYTSRGEVLRMWGDVPQPVEFGYDSAYGERVSMKTWRDTGVSWTSASWPSPSGGDETVWAFDPATGLLTSKTDAASDATEYLYTVAGKLEERAWARGVSTSYAYDADSGDLDSVDYSDTGTTPDLEYTYTRGGRIRQVDDKRSGANQFDILYAYNSRFEPTLEDFTGSFSRTLTRGFASDSIGRVSQLSVGSEYEANYFYADTIGTLTTGRMSRVTGPGLPTGTGSAYGAIYSYVADSNLVEMVSYRDQTAQPQFEVTRSFESERDLLTSVHNQWVVTTPPSTISKYTYVNDLLGRRKSALMEGAAFAGTGAGGTHWNRYKYNDRNELIDAEQYTGSTVVSDFATTPSDPAVNAGFHEYDYDPIGNRTGVKHQQSPVLATDYTSNNLNQYSASATVNTTSSPTVAVMGNQFGYDLDGNLIDVQLSGDANCNGVVNSGDIGAFILAITNPTQYLIDYPDCPLSNSDADGNGATGSGDIGYFTNFAAGGNAGQVATTYSYDAENRLISAEPMYPLNGNQRVQYAYDHMGRRARMWTETISCGSPCTAGTWSQGTSDVDIRYVWDGWLLLEELDGRNSNAGLRKYTWGLDLAGLNGIANDRTSAGGVGGLLAVEQTGSGSAEYWYAYDANGNVTEAISSAGAVAVHYEYDPYGKRSNPPIAGELEQPFQFSTKPYEDIVNTYYYGYRVYSPSLGRWINRDPLAEFSDVLLTRFVGNAPAVNYDAHGLISACATMVDKRDEGGQRVDWFLALDSPAPCDGFFVQHITVVEASARCQAERCPGAMSTTTEFWERFPLKKGQRGDSMGPSDESPRTDQWIDPASGEASAGTASGGYAKTCGTRLVAAEIRFYCDTAVMADGEWRRGNDPGVTGPNRASGNASSTMRRPSFWDLPSVEAPVTNSMLRVWNNCCCSGRVYDELYVRGSGACQN